MKGIKERVLARLHSPEKVELQAEQIDLNAFKDLKDGSDNADSLASKAFGDLQKAAENLSKMANNYESLAEKEVKRLSQGRKEYAKAAKELGFSPDNNAIYTGADSSLRQMKELASSCKKISNAVKGGAIGNL